MENREGGKLQLGYMTYTKLLQAGYLKGGDLRHRTICEEQYKSGEKEDKIRIKDKYEYLSTYSNLRTQSDEGINPKSEGAKKM